VLAEGWSRLAKKRRGAAVERALSLVAPRVAEERLLDAGILVASRGSRSLTAIAPDALPAVRAWRDAVLTTGTELMAVIDAAAATSEVPTPPDDAVERFAQARADERVGAHATIWAALDDTLRRASAPSAH
jgi:hypothetical protein